MKKMLILCSVLLILTGCKKKQDSNPNVEHEKGITYTCKRYEKYKKKDLDRRDGKDITSDSDTTAIELTISKIYNFDETGEKLLTFFEVNEYKYLLDYNMNKEKEILAKSCDNAKEYGYKSCNASLSGKIVTIKRELDLNNEDYKESANKATLQNIKDDYAGGEIYTCY